MDSKIMELRLKQWMPILEEQAKSGMNKLEWCKLNGVNRSAFFKWQRELREYLLEKNKNISQDKLSTELAVHTIPDFVELTPTGSSRRSNLNDSCVKSGGLTSAPSISIKCGEFSINLNNDVNELLLSKVLKVMADVY